MCFIYYTEKSSTLYILSGRKGKINYQSSYILFNPYGHKGSEFAPIVIHVYFILCILYRKEKCENFTEHNKNIL